MKVNKLIPIVLFFILGINACQSCVPKLQDEDQIFPMGQDEGGEISFKEEEDDPTDDPTGKYDYSLLSTLRHPRVLIDSVDFTILKDKVTKYKDQNQSLYRVHSIVMDKADEYINESGTISYKFDASNKRLLAQSRKAVRKIFACAYAYRMTGREQYLTCVKKDMQTVCSFKDWNGIKHYLDAAEMAFAVAIGYDWCYYQLPLSLRRQAHACMRDFALAISAESHDYRNMTNNWNQVCYGGTLAAALAIYEKDKSLAASYIEDLLKNNKKAIDTGYNPDGNYAEGYTYWAYGTDYQVLLFAMLEKIWGNAGGLDEITDMSKTAEWILYMSAMNGRNYAYSDCSVMKDSPQYSEWYFANKFKRVELLYNERRHLGNYTDCDMNWLLPMSALFFGNIDFPDDIPAPAKRVWSGKGQTPVVLVHGNWKFDESDKFLGFKGGNAKVSHAHMDAGSFVYDAYGKRWSEDLQCPQYDAVEKKVQEIGGNFWDSAEGSRRWEVFVMTNYAHSTITANEAKFAVAGQNELVEVYDSDTEWGGKINITNALKNQLSSAVRTVKIVNDKDLVVIDEITARSDKDAKIWWRMMTEADCKVTASKVELSYSDCDTKMELTATCTGGITPKMTKWDPCMPTGPGFLDDPQDGRTLAGHELTIPAGKSVVITTILSPKSK